MSERREKQWFLSYCSHPLDAYEHRSIRLFGRLLYLLTQLSQMADQAPQSPGDQRRPGSQDCASRRFT